MSDDLSTPTPAPAPTWMDRLKSSFGMGDKDARQLAPLPGEGGYQPSSDPIQSLSYQNPDQGVGQAPIENFVGDLSGPTLPPPPSLYEGVTPSFAYITNAYAKGVQSQTVNDSIWQRATQGQTIDDQDNENMAMHQQQEDQALAAQLTNQVHEQLKNLNEGEYHAAMEHVTQLLQNPPEMPQPAQLQQPSLLGGAVAGLGSVLFRRQAGEIASTPFVNGLQEQAKTDKDNQTAYAQQVAQQQRGIAGYNAVADNILAQTRVGVQGLENQLQAVNQRIQRTDNNTRIRGDALTNALNRATSPTAAKAIMRQIGNLGDAFKFSKEEQDQIVKDVALKGLKSARDELKSQIGQYTQDGVLDDKDKAAVDKMARTLESTYELPKGILGDAPTYTTLKKHAQDVRQDDWKKTFDQRQSIFDSRQQQQILEFNENYLRQVFNSAANLDIQHQRLMTADYNAQTSRGQLLLSQYNAAAKDQDHQINQALNGKGGLNELISGQQMAYQKAHDNAVGNPDNKEMQAAAAREATKLDDLKGRAAYLTNMHQPEIQIQLPGGGQMMVQNPQYQQPGQNPQAPQGVPQGPGVLPGGLPDQAPFDPTGQGNQNGPGFIKQGDKVQQGMDWVAHGNPNLSKFHGDHPAKPIAGNLGGTTKKGNKYKVINP